MTTFAVVVIGLAVCALAGVYYHSSTSPQDVDGEGGSGGGGVIDLLGRYRRHHRHRRQPFTHIDHRSVRNPMVRAAFDGNNRGVAADGEVGQTKILPMALPDAYVARMPKEGLDHGFDDAAAEMIAEMAQLNSSEGVVVREVVYEVNWQVKFKTFNECNHRSGSPGVGGKGEKKTVLNRKSPSSQPRKGSSASLFLLSTTTINVCVCTHHVSRVARVLPPP